MQLLRGKIKREPSERAFVLRVLVKTDFSKANFAAWVGISSEKYLTATRFPSESNRRIFFTVGHDSWQNQTVQVVPEKEPKKERKEHNGPCHLNNRTS